MEVSCCVCGIVSDRIEKNAEYVKVEQSEYVFNEKSVVDVNAKPLRKPTWNMETL